MSRYREIASFVFKDSSNFSYTLQTIGLVDIGNSVSIVEILVFASLIRKVCKDLKIHFKMLNMFQLIGKD